MEEDAFQESEVEIFCVPVKRDRFWRTMEFETRQQDPSVTGLLCRAVQPSRGALESYSSGKYLLEWQEIHCGLDCWS
ncbi:hypothetical protein MPTK1_3g21850 [Marchantia polymorpha subsp. ruderalis]|uniref:Uncharacterized protein n=2 Tax=Marchantia polymorpha TaxID=3197 RepID=A0AAF6B3D5_MARPO|nr:hypothetical protein MARPO_0089s0031 [Marchantia polymorpha]BBN06519.1 hypothetical protein Mp_3g21850 [Marchantia polymorpha subsp. ruderalis]|eukprot:PTQ33399.1 hypothetical protein MARPO_0089s0031 [Marchantia polymorpha]